MIALLETCDVSEGGSVVISIEKRWEKWGRVELTKERRKREERRQVEKRGEERRGEERRGEERKTGIEKRIGEIKEQ
jgi:hypothetical protein